MSISRRRFLVAGSAALAVAANVKDGRMTSSPGFTVNSAAISKAAVHECVRKAFGLPRNVAMESSTRLVKAPSAPTAIPGDH